MPASHLIRAGLALCFCLPFVGLAEATLSLEDFETEVARNRVHRGGEFPGASGSLRTHSGCRPWRWTRRAVALRFLATAAATWGFSFGPARPPEQIAESANALALWSAGRADMNLRCVCGGSGQTFQRPFDCPPDRWTRVIVPFEQWTVHWGGPNDGRVRGGPVLLRC
jgi:hypothetical protein